MADIISIQVTFPDPIIRAIVIESFTWPFLSGTADPVTPPTDRYKKWLYENETTSRWFRWMVGEQTWAAFG